MERTKEEWEEIEKVINEQKVEQIKKYMFLCLYLLFMVKRRRRV